MTWSDVSSRESAQPRKNILNSLLWLTGITFPSGTAAITFGPWPMSLIPFAVGGISALATIWYYRHWSNRDPDRLQTEDFNLQRDAIAKFGAGGEERAIEIDRTKLIDNPVKEDAR